MSEIFIEIFGVKIESKYVFSEFLCHLAHDVKKLFSVRGKLAISSDLSSNISDTKKTARLQSTRKINLKFDLHKNTVSVEKQIVFHLVSVSASQTQSFQDIKPLCNRSAPLHHKKSVCKPFFVA